MTTPETLAAELLATAMAAEEHPGIATNIRAGRYPRGVAVIAAALTAPDGVGWQPIASAPNDGREAMVGVWVKVDDSKAVWSQWPTCFDGGPLGCDGINGDDPTHWHNMIPAPPAIEAGEHGGSHAGE